MTSSFTPQAQPIDTFVRPSTVAPTTGFDQLLRALETVNPGVQKYLDYQIKEEIKEEQAEGLEIAIEASANDFKDITKSVRKKDGEEAARELIGGSIWAQKAYEKTKAEILGTNVLSKLNNSYLTTVINDRSLNSYTFDSPEIQGWLEGQRNQFLEQLNDVNPTYVKKYFLPKLAEATATITNHHIKDHKNYNIEQIKGLAVPLVRTLISSDSDEQSEIAIKGFELSVKQLGIQGKDLTAINKLLVETLADYAEEAGINGNGDLASALEILDLADKFSYGPNGQHTLTSHPDFLDEKNRITKLINNLEYNLAVRKEKLEEINKTNDLEIMLKDWGKLNEQIEKATDKAEKANLKIQSQDLIKNFKARYPDLAPRITTIMSNLDTNNVLSYGEILGRIRTGGYTDKQEAMFAAFSFLSSGDPATNRPLFDNLMKAIDRVDSGQYTYATQLLGKLESQIKGELTNVPGAIFLDSGELKGVTASELNRLVNQGTDDFFTWVDRYIEDNGKAPSRSDTRKWFNENIRDVLLEEAKGFASDDKGDEKTNVKLEGDNKGDADKNLEGDADKNLEGDLKNQGQNQNQTQNWKKSLLNALIGNYYNPQIINVSTLETMLENEFITPSEGGRFVDKKGNYYKLEEGSLMPSLMTDTSVSVKDYEVKAGDTLTNLAEQFSTTIQEIKDANNITDEDFIKIGQKLLMPINTIGDALVSESDLQNPSVLDEIDITKPFKYDSLYRLAQEVGFTPEQARIMAAIALAESGGKAQTDTVKSGLDPEKKNEFSLGLWQINMVEEYAPERLLDFNIESEQELYNPAVNARAAKIMFDKQGYEAWGAYRNGSYKTFLPKTT